MRKGCKTYHTIVLAIAAFMLFGSVRLNAQRLNYEIVSLYVYNFTKYIEWPKVSDDVDFVVGVYGESGLTAELNKYISSKHVGVHSIVVKVITTPEEAAKCNIVFLPAGQSNKIKELTDQLKNKPVLIISEKFGMSKKGASISIFLDEDDDDKTKFEISKTAIDASGLIISTNLLRMASQVY